MKPSVEVSSNHITLAGSRVKLKEGNRFYANPTFFEAILKEYKTDLDLFWPNNHILNEDVEVKVIQDHKNDSVVLKGFNKKGATVWHSVPIYDVWFDKVFAYTAILVFSIFGIAFSVFYWLN